MLGRFATKRFTNFFYKTSTFSTSHSRADLCGRDIILPMELTTNEWKKLLWCAFDFKQSMQKSRECLNIISDKHATFLFTKPSARLLLACSLACQILGVKSTLYNDPAFELLPNFVDTGRALSQITDLFLANGCSQEILIKLAEGSSAPVIALTTNLNAIIKALAFLMTIQETYGQLNRIKVAWVGPSSPLCNSILSLFPPFGINLNICCICAHGTGPMTPVTMKDALISCEKGMAELHQVSNAADAVYRAHVIITGSHSEVDYRVTMQMVEEAEFEWIYLHPLPRTDIEVTDDVFTHKRNFTWVSSANHLYVAMAMIASALIDYRPGTAMPRFFLP